MADIRVIDLPTNVVTLSSDLFIFESTFEDIPGQFVTSKNSLSTLKDEFGKFFTTGEQVSATLTTGGYITNDQLSGVLLSGGYVSQTTALAYSIAL